MKRIAFLVLAASVMIVSCKGKRNIALSEEASNEVSSTVEATDSSIEETSEQTDDVRPLPYDWIDLSDHRSDANIPEFKWEPDERAWKVLAGIYVKDEPPESIPEEMYETDTPWGKDYVDFGVDELTISYKDGEWYFNGAGMTEVVELKTISYDGKNYEFQNDWYPVTCKFDGEYVDILGDKYYKLTGPDCYKRFLKEFTKGYRSDDENSLALDEYFNEPNFYDFVDLSDSFYTSDTPDFKSELDGTAWKTLAGVYVLGGPRSFLGYIEEDNNPWGRDFTDFGHGRLTVYYNDGIWYFGGDGEAVEYKLESVSPDRKSFQLKNDWHSCKCEVKDEYLYIDGRSYYKVTGPDCYKRFLKKFMGEYDESIDEYIRDYGDKIKVGDIKKVKTASREIITALKNGDIETYSKYVDKSAPVDIQGVGDCDVFDYEDLSLTTELSQAVKNCFKRIQTDLELQDVTGYKDIYVNQFLHMSFKDFKSYNKKADFIAEFIFNNYEYVQFLFKKKDGKFVLVGLVDYARFSV